MLVFLWWCSCSGVVVFLWWCFCVGGVVVFLWWCGGVFVVVVWWCFCGGVVARELVLFSLCQHPARELVLVAVLQDCGGVFGVFVVLFLVFLWWWCRGINIRPENLYFSAFCKITHTELTYRVLP